MMISGQNVGHRVWIAKANCLKITDSGDRAACEAGAKDEQKEDSAICTDQKNARKQLSGLTVENQYQPDNAGDIVPVNPCLPLTAGARTGYYRCLSTWRTQKNR